jgi:hypothetical protein
MTAGCYEPRQARGARHKVMGNKERENVQTLVAESSKPQGEGQAVKTEGTDREGRTGVGKAEQAYREARSQPGRKTSRTASTETNEQDPTSTTRPTDLPLVTVRRTATPRVSARPGWRLLPSRHPAAPCFAAARDPAWPHTAAEAQSPAVKRPVPISAAVFAAVPQASAAE